MLIREVADNSKYYHDTLAAQLPAGLTDDDDILGKAFVIAGMKLGMVKAARMFRETPGFEQDVVAAYHRLHNDLEETVAVDDNLADAQEIGAQLQSAMEDLYYAHRMGNPNPTVKQNIDMLQKSVRSLNQELNALGYKYAPTVPGLVAKMGTRFVEDDMNIDEIIKEGEVVPFARPGQQLTWQQVPKDILLLANDWFWASEDDSGLDAEKDREGYGNGTANEVKYIAAKLQQKGWTIDRNDEHDDRYGPWHLLLRNNKGQSVLLDIEDAQTFSGWAKGTSQYDSVEEGFRVSAPQIPGTQNRAKTAYYPTNTKPRVPKLDTPLTDKELARLSQLAGIKTNK